MRKVFRKVHLWLSVPFGVVITLICFSGAMLALEKIVNPNRPEHPRHKTHAVAATSPHAAVGKQEHVGKQEQAGKQQHVGRPQRSGFFLYMFRLHRWLLDSPARHKEKGGIFWGKLVVGVSTLMFVMVLISGLIIWLPRSRKAFVNSLKIPIHRGWKRFWYGLHVAGGMYAFVFLLVMALTGLTWSFPWYRSAFHALFGSAEWIYAVHVGSWGGLPTRILAFVASMIGALLPITGYYLWIKKLYRSRTR